MRYFQGCGYRLSGYWQDVTDTVKDKQDREELLKEALRLRWKDEISLLWMPFTLFLLFGLFFFFSHCLDLPVEYD